MCSSDLERRFPCVVWKGFPAFPAHLRMRPVSRGNSRRATWVGRDKKGRSNALCDFCDFGFPNAFDMVIKQGPKSWWAGGERVTELLGLECDVALSHSTSRK